MSLSLIAIFVLSLELRFFSLQQQKYFNAAVDWFEEGSPLYRKSLNDAKIKSAALFFETPKLSLLKEFQTEHEPTRTEVLSVLNSASKLCLQRVKSGEECICDEIDQVSKFMVPSWQEDPLKILSEASSQAVNPVSMFSCCMKQKPRNNFSWNRETRLDFRTFVEKFNETITEAALRYEARLRYNIFLQLLFVKSMFYHQELNINSALKMFRSHGQTHIKDFHIKNLNALSPEAYRMNLFYQKYSASLLRLNSESSPSRPNRSTIPEKQQERLLEFSVERLSKKIRDANQCLHDLHSDVRNFMLESFDQEMSDQKAEIELKEQNPKNNIVEQVNQASEESKRVLCDLEKSFEELKAANSRALFEEKVRHQQMISELEKSIDEEKQKEEIQREEDSLKERQFQEIESTEQDHVKKLVARVKLRHLRDLALRRARALKKKETELKLLNDSCSRKCVEMKVAFDETELARHNEIEQMRIALQNQQRKEELQAKDPQQFLSSRKDSGNDFIEKTQRIARHKIMLMEEKAKCLRSDSVCTFFTTRRVVHFQKSYRCQTCESQFFPHSDFFFVVCECCKNLCHKDHIFVENFPLITATYCECNFFFPREACHRRSDVIIDWIRLLEQLQRKPSALFEDIDFPDFESAGEINWIRVSDISRNESERPPVFFSGGISADVSAIDLLFRKMRHLRLFNMILICSDLK